MNGFRFNEPNSLSAAMGDQIKTRDIRGKFPMKLRVCQAFVFHVSNLDSGVFEKGMVEVVPGAMARDVNIGAQ